MAARTLLVLLALTCTDPPAAAQRIYHIDPRRGLASGDGSARRPWRTLEEAIARGELKGIEGGSQVLLASGDHGAVILSGSNEKAVTIAALPGQQPHLSRLELRAGSRWILSGLSVSPSYGTRPYGGSILSVGERGPSEEIVVQDCFIHGGLDSSRWSVEQWMKANSGMRMGRHARKLIFRNNYILNTRFAIDLCAPRTTTR